MIQISAALEANISGKAVTVTGGWGLNTFANVPWWGNLFGIIRQGAVGIRRYGLIVLGFFITAQYCDIAAVQASLMRPSPLKRALRAGAAIPPQR